MRSRIEEFVTCFLSHRRNRYPEIAHLNLIYHVSPLAGNDLWRANLDLLRPHLGRFHRRVFGVVQGESMVPFDSVREELVGWEIEWLIRPNDSSLGEVATFPGLLERVASPDPRQATFYAHTKGVSRRHNRAVGLWREAMYRACLGELGRVMDFLRYYACAGAFKKLGHQFDRSVVPRNHFHYAGSFFWVRNDRLFSRPDWRSVPPSRFGVEAYLGQFFKSHEAACLYGAHAGDLYHMAEWNRLLARDRRRGEEDVALGHAGDEPPRGRT